jgi:hypothetical protein
MQESISREQQFLMLVQTAAIVKELSGEVEEILKVRRADNLAAHVTLGVAMEVFQYVPDKLDVLQAASQFIDYIYSKEKIPSKPAWMLESGF